MSGWIKLYRSIQDNPIWESEPFDHSHAWIDLLLCANHKDGAITKRGIFLTVPRGYIGYSEKTLSRRWRWSRGKVRRFFVFLVQQNMIEIVQQKNKITTLIHIINYNSYQSNDTTEIDIDGTTNEQRMNNGWTKNGTTNGTTKSVKKSNKIKDLDNKSQLDGTTNGTTNEHQTGQQTVHEQERKNERKIIYREKFSPPVLQEITNYCLERKNTIDPETFFNHYESNGWMIGKVKMKNWQAAIRTWERNENKIKKYNPLAKEFD